MKAHYHYTTTLVGGGSTSVLKQINILPSMLDFDELVNQAQFYQQYTMLRCDYKLRVVNSTVSTMGTRLPPGITTLQPSAGLIEVFKVRLENNQIPEIAPKNYCAYDKLTYHYANEPIAGSFVPYVSVS